MLRCKLSAQDVLEIYKRRQQSAGQVCLEFGVSDKTIRDIWSGRTWKHVTDLQPALRTIDDELFRWNQRGQSIDPKLLDAEWFSLSEEPLPLYCS